MISVVASAPLRENSQTAPGVVRRPRWRASAGAPADGWSSPRPLSKRIAAGSISPAGTQNGGARGSVAVDAVRHAFGFIAARPTTTTTGAGTSRWATYQQPGILPPVLSDERLSFAVDQFTGSGQRHSSLMWLEKAIHVSSYRGQLKRW